MVCFTCQHLHTATGKKCLILLCKKSLVRLEGVCPQFSCTQNSSVNTLRLSSTTKIKMSFFLSNSVRQCKAWPKPQCIQVPALTKTQNQTKKPKHHQHEGCQVKHAKVRKYRNGTLWKGQHERWEDKKLFSKEQSEQRSVRWPHLLLPLTQALCSSLTLKLLGPKSVQEIS